MGDVEMSRKVLSHQPTRYPRLSDSRKLTFALWRPQACDCYRLVTVHDAVQEVVDAILATREQSDDLHGS